MISTKDRLERGARILGILDERRSKTEDARLGSVIESFIVSREIEEIEEEILQNPGALEAFLAKRK